MEKLFEAASREDDAATAEMERKSVANKVLLEYSSSLDVGGVIPTRNYIENMLNAYTEVLAYTYIYNRMIPDGNSDITEMPTYIKELDIFTQNLKGLGITKEEDIKRALHSLINAVSPSAFVKKANTSITLVKNDFLKSASSVLDKAKSICADKNPPETDN